MNETVEQYVQRLRSGEILPALKVRYDGQQYFLEDGFHRIEAAKRCGLETVKVEVSPGTLADMEAEFRAYLTKLKESLKNGR